MADIFAALPKRVTVVEVGPRDGLQNERALIATDRKVAFINALSDAGLPVIEATSMVSSASVPQLADGEEVMRAIARRTGVRYPVPCPMCADLSAREPQTLRRSRSSRLPRRRSTSAISTRPSRSRWNALRR